MRGKGRSGTLAKAAIWGLGGLGLVLVALMPVRAAELVHFKELMQFAELKIPGWQMEGKPSGTTMKHEGMKMSEVKANYRSGDKTLEIQILDFWGQTIPRLGMPVQLEIESSEESMRTTQIEGHKALETYKPQEKHGELSISVADRFWVRIVGQGIDNVEPLKAVAQQMDLKKLAALAK
jgi:hypothetical protein